MSQGIQRRVACVACALHAHAPQSPVISNPGHIQGLPCIQGKAIPMLCPAFIFSLSHPPQMLVPALRLRAELYHPLQQTRGPCLAFGSSPCARAREGVALARCLASCAAATRKSTAQLAAPRANSACEQARTHTRLDTRSCRLLAMPGAGNTLGAAPTLPGVSSKSCKENTK